MPYRPVIAVVLVIILFGAGWVTSRPRGSEPEQIRRLLLQAQDAARAKNISGCLSCLSSNYKGAGGSRDEIRLFLLSVFRDTGTVDVVVNEPTIKVTGETATAETHVNITVRAPKGSGNTSYSSDVTLEFCKEEHKRYFIFPVREWRISSARLKTGIGNLF